MNTHLKNKKATLLIQPQQCQFATLDDISVLGCGLRQSCGVSQVLAGLPIAMLEQTAEQLTTEAKTDATICFSRQIASL